MKRFMAWLEDTWPNAVVFLLPSVCCGFFTVPMLEELNQDRSVDFIVLDLCRVATHIINAVLVASVHQSGGRGWTMFLLPVAVFTSLIIQAPPDSENEVFSNYWIAFCFSLFGMLAPLWMGLDPSKTESSSRAVEAAWLVMPTQFFAVPIMGKLTIAVVNIIKETMK